MFSFVLLFGVINAISGTNTTISPTSNSTSVAGIYTYFHMKMTSPVHGHTTSLVKNSSQTSEGNSSVPSTKLPSTIPTATTSLSSPAQNLSAMTIFQSTSVEVVRIITPTSTGAPPMSSKRVSPTFTTFGLSTSPEKSSETITTISTSGALQTSQTIKPTRTATKNTTDKEKIFFWHVTTETLKYMFYGTAGVLLICIILLIICCCCWRRLRKTTKKLKRKDTMLSNPYTNSDRNNHQVVGFPSPLQLDTFVIKPESPYDMPEVDERPPEDLELSYVSVIDENESDSQYAEVKGNGTANSIADGESRDGDSQMTPEYANSSAFDPYQELMPAANRGDEDHYTSLIKRDEIEDNEANV